MAAGVTLQGYAGKGARHSNCSGTRAATAAVFQTEQVRCTLIKNNLFCSRKIVL